MADRVDSGAAVGRFRIQSVLGEGASGIVYLADDDELQERVALKLLAPEFAEDERFRRRFLRETELAASLEHPNVVRTISAGEEGGQLFLAMDYVEGCDLRELIRRERRLDPDRAISLVAQAAEALDAAHAAGLVHRDVKPRNILVESGTEDERAYVCDFGLARHVSSVSSLTGDRGFVGTVDYVAPEQIEGAEIDARADIYSLGCVLFECLSGSRPFDRESELSVVFAHLNEPPPLLSDLRPDLPDAFDAVFATALAKSPDQRYSSCRELADAARAASEGKTFRRLRSRRRRLLLAAVAVLGGISAASGAVLATRDDSPTGRGVITQTSLAGAKVGLPAQRYKSRFGGWRAETLTDVDYSGLAFQQPQVAVYFPPNRKRATIITTWNKGYQTDVGIGPCSTLEEMKDAYGDRVKATWAGSSPNGKKHWSWAVGQNLLFVTQDQKTISAVALYNGVPVEKHGGSPQDFANYVGAVETACK